MQTTIMTTVLLAQGQPTAAAPTGTVAAPSTYETLGTGAPEAGSTGAAGTVGGGAPLPTGAAPQGPFGGGFIWILVLMMVFMVGVSMLSGRKDRKRRAELMSNLKRNDQVVTTSGIMGSVAEIRDDEVVLLTDETSRTRIRVTRASISQILNAGATGGAGKVVPVDADIHVKSRSDKATV